MEKDLDIFDPVRGAAREAIDATELSLAVDRAAIIMDRRRRRPNFFDDRFLTARDLTREQQYGLLRQADLAQLSGAGVVRGLRVSSNAAGTALQIAPGHGVARSGESVAIRDELALGVSSLRLVRQQPGSKELVATDAASAAQTGLFVLTAFPVEHARTPGLAFPNGTVEPKLADTEIVESTWFGLVPVPNVEPKETSGQGRARLAREVFLGGFDPTALTQGLALALLGITGGHVQWIDQPMVVRRVGGDGVLSLGAQRRKVRLAFQEQYSEHLAQELTRRRNAGLPDGLAATEAFHALPPVGPLPRGAVQFTTTDVRQTFFPRELYVELAVVPEDEVAALLAEGLTRAPIDLKLPAAALEGVPVLIVVPVPRAGYDEQVPRMTGAYRGPSVPTTGRPLASVRPIDALAALRAKNEVPVVADPIPLDLETWRKAVESATEFWYVRRQQFASTSVVIPRLVRDEAEPREALERLDSEDARARITSSGEADRFNRLFARATPELLGEAGALLGATLSGSAENTSLYASSIIGELAYAARRQRPNADAAAPAPISALRRQRALAAADAPAAPTPSPALTRDYESRVGPLALRPLQVEDVRRVASRFAVDKVAEFCQNPELQTPEIRSVLASSVVVPELALWAASLTWGNGVRFIAAVATAGGVDAVEGLRELARRVTLAVTTTPTPRPPAIASTKPAKRVDPWSALRSVGHKKFLTELDRMLETKNLGLQPVFANWLLMRLLVVGYELPIREDADVEALLGAIDRAHATADKFAAPNRNAGRILAAEQHEARDQLLREAAKFSPKTVVAAQKRLLKAGFAADYPDSEQSVLAHQLLALASERLDHIALIANAPDAAFKALIKSANHATKSRSVREMRRALRRLSAKPGGK